MKKGFTLIELLVVISIIALLSSIVLSSVNTARAYARDARRAADLYNLRLALEIYYIDNGQYPEDVNDLVPTYIQVLPTDPVTDETYTYSHYPTEGSSVAENACVTTTLERTEDVMAMVVGESLEFEGTPSDNTWYIMRAFPAGHNCTAARLLTGELYGSY